MGSLYGVNCYAKNRTPDGSGRDLLITLDPGFRFGRDQQGFGSLPRSPAPPHPFFHRTEPRSLLAFDDNWTDVYGLKPRSAKRQTSSRERNGDATLCRMRGGNYALIFPKKATASWPGRAAGAPHGSRSASLPCKSKLSGSSHRSRR
mmetsp:Transcript_106353/g.331688  ORF Transcript_106353/g.331688 Transcript_106353/m.331688 type:complete len:147 (+) Transcript_106353:64-504(+)